MRAYHSGTEKLYFVDFAEQNGNNHAGGRFKPFSLSRLKNWEELYPEI